LPESASRFWRRLEIREKVSGVMRDKRPSPWKPDGRLENGWTVPL
jgi:hypothetical protein